MLKSRQDIVQITDTVWFRIWKIVTPRLRSLDTLGKKPLMLKELCLMIYSRKDAPITRMKISTFIFPKRAMERDWEVTILEMPEGKDSSVSYEEFNDGRFEADV